MPGLRGHLTSDMLIYLSPLSLSAQSRFCVYVNFFSRFGSISHQIIKSFLMSIKLTHQAARTARSSAKGANTAKCILVRLKVECDQRFASTNGAAGRAHLHTGVPLRWRRKERAPARAERIMMARLVRLCRLLSSLIPSRRYALRGFFFFFFFF